MESSEENQFIAQDFEFSTNKDFAANFNEQVLHQKQSSFKKEHIKKLHIRRQSEQGLIPSIDKDTLLSVSKCPSHPDEDLQFYCFNKDQLLCPECLVSGKYVGNEVSNLKKAAERLKNKFGSLVIQGIGKFEAFNSIEEQIEAYEDEIEKTAYILEEAVTKQMNEVRQKINEKEQELLKSILTIKQERKTELKQCTKWLQEYREEVDSAKYVEEGGLKDRGDLELCKFYSKKMGTMTNFIGADINFNTQDIKETIEAYKTKDRTALSKIKEECKALTLQLEGLTFPELDRSRQNTGNSTRETFQPTITNFLVQSPEFTLSSARKDSKDHGLQRNIVPPKMSDTPKKSFLSKAANEGLFNVDSLTTTSHTTRNLERNFLKSEEVKRLTPKGDLGFDTRFALKDYKKPDKDLNLMIQLRRESANTRTNRNGVSQNETSSILESYKEILTRRTSGVDIKTPRTPAISIGQAPVKPLSGLSTPNNLLTPRSILSTPGTSRVETREKSASVSVATKNNLATFISDMNKNSIKAFARGSEPISDQNKEKTLAKRKVSERPGAIDSNDFGLRGKLNKLSNELLKW